MGVSAGFAVVVFALFAFTFRNETVEYANDSNAPGRRRRGPPGREFRPRPMKISILTAALQELTPRERREADPTWPSRSGWNLRGDRLPHIELSAALHPARATSRPPRFWIPWPHLGFAPAIRRPPRGAHPQRHGGDRVGLSDLAYFDNMLAADDSVRGKKHALMLRVFDAAVLLGTDAVTGFVGRNPLLEMDANLLMFEQVFVPLLKEAKARGLTFRVEQCPMPDGTSPTSGTTIWPMRRAVDCIAPDLRAARRRRSVRIHYDPSHAILMGQDSRSVFQYLKDEAITFSSAVSMSRVRSSTRAASRPGATADRPCNAAIGMGTCRPQPVGAAKCVEEANGVRRT